jgi:plastocyanin
MIPALAVTLAVSACGTGSAPAQPSASPTPSGSGAGAKPSAAAAEQSTALAESGNLLVETATDNKFSPASYAIKAGDTYTLALSNKGQALHNWRINDAKGPDGKDISAPLLESGRTASVSFSLAKAGTYHFVCDVHPEEMTGTLSVR